MTSKNLNPHVNVSQCSRAHCQEHTKYYCLTCEKNLCSTCEEKHSINLDTKDHNIKLYKYKNGIPRIREPCKKHPYQVYEKYCNFCELPFCVDCTEHKEHYTQDVLSVYEDHREIIKTTRSNILYALQVVLKKIKQDINTCRNKNVLLLSAMETKLPNVESFLDTCTKQFAQDIILKRRRNCLAKISKHLSEIRIFDKMQQKFANKPVKILQSIGKPRFIDMTKTPVFVQHYLVSPTEVDMQYLLELLKIQINERGKRTIENKHLLKLNSFPELQESLSLKEFTSCEHISCVTRDKAWISEKSTILLIDITNRNILYRLDDAVYGFSRGLHTVNVDCDLFYISKHNSIIKLSSDRETSISFLDNFDPSCVLLSLCCSPSTGDLLIGMKIKNTCTYEETGIIVRFDKSGQLKMTIPVDDTKETLFKDPNYVTENNNGDVVVSDYWRGVVVTDRGGKHLFTYKDTPFGSRLLPRGICTDALSNILVCDDFSETILILNKEGCFHIQIPAQISHDPYSKPCSLSYDLNTHLLWVGSWNTTVSRYRHITRFELSGKSLN